MKEISKNYSCLHSCSHVLAVCYIQASFDWSFGREMSSNVYENCRIARMTCCTGCIATRCVRALSLCASVSCPLEWSPSGTTDTLCSCACFRSCDSLDPKLREIGDHSLVLYRQDPLPLRQIDSLSVACFLCLWELKVLCEVFWTSAPENKIRIFRYWCTCCRLCWCDESGPDCFVITVIYSLNM